MCSCTYPALSYPSIALALTWCLQVRPAWCTVTCGMACPSRAYTSAIPAPWDHLVPCSLPFVVDGLLLGAGSAPIMQQRTLGGCIMRHPQPRFLPSALVHSWTLYSFFVLHDVVTSHRGCLCVTTCRALFGVQFCGIVPVAGACAVPPFVGCMGLPSRAVLAVGGCRRITCMWSQLTLTYGLCMARCLRKCRLTRRLLCGCRFVLPTSSPWAAFCVRVTLGDWRLLPVVALPCILSWTCPLPCLCLVCWLASPALTCWLVVFLLAVPAPEAFRALGYSLGL